MQIKILISYIKRIIVDHPNAIAIAIDKIAISDKQLNEFLSLDFHNANDSTIKKQKRKKKKNRISTVWLPKILKLFAQTLNAKVLGDEGELYDESYFSKQQPSQIRTDNKKRKPWWKLW
jgi:hypothetical protein